MQSTKKNTLGTLLLPRGLFRAVSAATKDFKVVGASSLAKHDCRFNVLRAIRVRLIVLTPQVLCKSRHTKPAHTLAASAIARPLLLFSSSEVPCTNAAGLGNSNAIIAMSLIASSIPRSAKQPQDLRVDVFTSYKDSRSSAEMFGETFAMT